MKNSIVCILLFFLGIKSYSQQTAQAPTRGLLETSGIENVINFKNRDKKIQEMLLERFGRQNIFSLNDFLYFKYEFIFEARNPITCSVFKKRLSLYQTKVAELNDYLKSHENKSIFSQRETKNIQNIASEIIPSIVSPDEQYVELKVTWSRNKLSELFDGGSNWSKYLIEPEPNEPLSVYQFHIFHLEGPGLKWDGESGEETSFLKLRINGDIELRYKMSIFDLCLGQNSLRIDSLGFSGEVGKQHYLQIDWDLNHGYGPFYGQSPLEAE